MIYQRQPWETAQALEHYSTIYADPPWRFRDRCASGKRGVEFKYQTMTLEQIRELPVSLIACRDATLHLWVPASMTPTGIRVLEEWGFQFQTVSFVWVKLLKKKSFKVSIDNKPAPGRPGRLSSDVRVRDLQRFLKMGMGNWTRNEAEIVLMGRRGKPKRSSASVRQVVLAPWRNADEPHSAKPKEVRERILHLGPDGPRIELFARDEGRGWDAWGDELQGDGALEEPLRD